MVRKMGMVGRWLQSTPFTGAVERGRGHFDQRESKEAKASLLEAAWRRVSISGLTHLHSVNARKHTVISHRHSWKHLGHAGKGGNQLSLLQPLSAWTGWCSAVILGTG